MNRQDILSLFGADPFASYARQRDEGFRAEQLQPYFPDSDLYEIRYREERRMA